MNDWAEKFVQGSLFHITTVAACAALMMGACSLGRRWRESERERMLRTGWGVLILGYQAWVTVWYLDGFQWKVSLPCQLCDLAAFVAGAAMIWPRRWLRTLLYFWGIGLSTQAFFTPIVHVGFRHLHYWMFWVGHTAIIGSAVYDVVVRGYRPTWKDLRFGILASVVYCVGAMVLDVAIDAAGVLPAGERANYGYVGNTHPDNPTIVDKLGPWPWRVGVLALIVIADFVMLWAVWPVARRVMGKAGPLASTGE